jgi:putative ABC transport system permease protein
VIQNLRYAVRVLRKTPGFTLTALATVAICLGANLTIFAVVDSVLLRPLPFPDADRLVSVFNTYPKAGVPNDGCSLPNYYERRGQIAAFAGLAAYREGTAIVGEAGSTLREPIGRVSPDFFATLGLGPVMGRAFTEAETTYETDRVAIVTDAWWRQRLNADPRAIGRTIRIYGIPHVIVGVLPPEFSFLSSKARIYLPLASNPDERGQSSRHSGTAHLIARLAPKATLGEAQSQVDAHNAALEAHNPAAPAMAAAGFRSIVVPLHADHVAVIRPTVLLMQAGALLLLLIGAVNVSNLLLIRASGRVKELAVRQAIGATRGHILREVLTETLALTLIGGLLGLIVGASGIRVLAALGSDQLPLGARIAFDARLAAIEIVGAIVLGLAIGLPIAWYNLRGQAASALQSESRTGTASRGAQRMRHGFLVAQMALAFVLLADAGLLAISLSHVRAVSPGFRPDHVASAQISLPGNHYPGVSNRLAFHDRLMQDLRGQPGVVAVGVATNVPLSGHSNKSAATIAGYRPRPGEPPRGIYSYSVDGDYFTAMGIVLREGRFLTADDSRRAERVCVVDEDFARRNWPGRSAIGQRLYEGSQEHSPAEAFTVVGVIAPVKQAALTDTEPQGAVYYPYGYRPDDPVFFVARTHLPPESLAATIQARVRAIDPELPAVEVRSMETRIDDSLIARRSPALLATIFAGIALLLTAIGTYGVLSYAVAQRRREIGVRMALGALPAQVRRQFVSVAVRLLAAGIVLGAIGAWLTGRAMQAILFHVTAFDATALTLTTIVLGVVCLIACLLPSHRAARISPMQALADQ